VQRPHQGIFHSIASGFFLLVNVLSLEVDIVLSRIASLPMGLLGPGNPQPRKEVRKTQRLGKQAQPLPP
jgi:hypothetical protein